MTVFTIGVYGWTEAEFFDALRKNRIELFCDIRRRRRLRGSEYAFANAVRLEEKLNTPKIHYAHLIDYAPSDELRYVIAQSGYRTRDALTPEFVSGYQSEILSTFSRDHFLNQIGKSARLLLFCVERLPDACHRSLLAAKLQSEFGAQLIHLLPSHASD